MDSSNLNVATDYQPSTIHTIALNFKYPLIFHAPVILGHKTFRCSLPYLLLCYVSKFFYYGLMHFLL